MRRHRTPAADDSERNDQAMSHASDNRGLNRRTFLRYAGGAILVAAVGVGGGPRAARSLGGPSPASAADNNPLTFELGGTDGWMYLPPSPGLGAFHPDSYAPDGLTTYIFGFRNVTGLTETEKFNQKNHAQHSAPLLWVDEYDGTNEVKIKLTNLGLAQRPDLFDAHTLHWHGFKNAIPYYDGEPSGSVAVPAGRSFEYAYRPHDPGTYMWHCHVEDVEHVQMGMTGMIFVRPAMNTPTQKYAYNHASTAYDREYAMFMSEVWAEAHWADAHIQLPEWSDYRADFALLNGRVYPDTVKPSSGFTEPHLHPAYDTAYRPYGAGGDLPAIAGQEELQYQPLSSLVTCNAGERVLLRFANLGFTQGTMTLTGIRARVVAKDATLLRGRGNPGVDGSFVTDSITLGAGESVDAIFEAPAYSGGTGTSGNGYDVYMLYNREFQRSNNLAFQGFGGQATEIHVYPANHLGAQVFPHQDVAS